MLVRALDGAIEADQELRERFTLAPDQRCQMLVFGGGGGDTRMVLDSTERDVAVARRPQMLDVLEIGKSQC